MKILKIIFLVILTINVFGDSIKDITNSSEIGYIFKFSGWDISSGKKVVANKISFISINGIAYRCIGTIYDDNSLSENRIKISAKKYIKFWKRIEQYNVWDLKTIDLEEINTKMKRKGFWDEELNPFKKDADISYDEFTIFIRVKDKEHKCTTIGIGALKDSRYKQVVIEIAKFLGIKEYKIL